MTSRHLRIGSVAAAVFAGVMLSDLIPNATGLFRAFIAGGIAASTLAVASWVQRWP